ncbi:MAG TPA: tripartite tricarboxylate transporter permease [Dongiaceae bacterium]|nr:tripartite tricarboxylate transporter permease [Dongiaceae bacterium]
MELLSHLALGFSVVLTAQNLFYAFVGCFVGTLIGVLPGIGSTATLSMLLPVTYALPPTPALIMLAGIYYGSQYGGSTTAILVNLPGESSSVVTAIDGYKMARKGRAGAALFAAGVSSFFAGCVATLAIAAFAMPLASLALKFGPAEYFSMMVVGLIGAVALASGRLINAIAMIVLGLLLGLVGTDINSGVSRFAFGSLNLIDGIDFVTVAMGVYGFAEVIANLEHKEVRTTITSKFRDLWPTGTELRRMTPAMLRGTALGSLLGVLPGAGTALASFVAYGLEKKIGRYKHEFGQGAIEGVASPEAANNAVAQTSFIPLLTLGIPGNAVMALMLAAMVIQNIQPGPLAMTANPSLFWGLIVSMWVGNLMLIILNLPMVGIWVKLLQVPYRFLYPAILVFCCIGLFSIENRVFDIYLGAFFGLLGYAFRKFGCDQLAPLLLGFVLGPMMEEYFRRTLVLSHGDFSVFVTRPISLGFLLLAAALVLAFASPKLMRKRAEVFVEEE